MKTYLDVPFSDKDAAKGLGARFDMARRQWFVPDGVDLMPFRRWLPLPKAQLRSVDKLAAALQSNRATRLR